MLPTNSAFHTKVSLLGTNRMERMYTSLSDQWSTSSTGAAASKAPGQLNLRRGSTADHDFQSTRNSIDNRVQAFHHPQAKQTFNLTIRGTATPGDSPIHPRALACKRGKDFISGSISH